MSTKGIQDIENDLSLWHCFISGDEQSFVYLYDKYVKLLFVYGLQYTTDKDLLKDCIQDVFIKLYQDKARLKHINNIRLYLHITLKNHLINTVKREQTHLRYIQSIDTFHEDHETVEIQMINKETDSNRQEKVAKIMLQLSSRQKEVIYYRFIENKSIDEISEILNINYQSVQNIIQRSIKKAREIFYKESEYISRV